MSDESNRGNQDESSGGQTLKAEAGGTTNPMGSVSDDDIVGRLIDGKYLVEALIGAGGFGKVYRGTNTRTDSPVAIKTLMPELLADEGLVKRFEIEAKSASNLRHPNTIRIYDFGQDGALLFMVMELLNGKSLEGVLADERTLEPARLIEIVSQICRSLDEAHAGGLVHRDIKPDNIFLNRVGHSDEEHVKVLDFGVAKLKDKRYGNATLTQAGMIFGTPRYMSPEQARAAEIDGRSDIYALGVIMYEALTGSAPFTADEAIGVLIKHVNEPPPPFAEMNPAMSPMPELEAIVMRCLAKTPDERFDDAKTFMNALDGVAEIYGATRRTGARPVDRKVPDTIAVGGGATAAAGLTAAGLETLGVSSGAQPRSDAPSKYTLGPGAIEHDTTGSQAGDGRSKVKLIIGAVCAIVVLLGFGILSIVGQSTSDPDDGRAEAEDSGGETERVTGAATLGPVVTVAHLSVQQATQDAAAAAAERVVTMELRAEPEGVAASARIDGLYDEAVPLPHTFVFTRDPASPPTTVKFALSAEGYRDVTHEAPLAETERPISVTLQPISRPRPATRSSGTWVPPPRRDSRREDTGLSDPYQ